MSDPFALNSLSSALVAIIVVYSFWVLVVVVIPWAAKTFYRWLRKENK